MNDLHKAALAALDALENHTAIKHPQQRAYRDEAIEALRDALNRQHTHSNDCWSWGPAHYDCALRKIGQYINKEK
jgi:hypothetical protein